ncbi:MAG: hypothetical protein GY950_07455 [bacterium]|nr:hypothetical protein [bacterium]
MKFIAKILLLYMLCSFPASAKSGESGDLFYLLDWLMVYSDESGRKNAPGDLQAFVAIYSKFHSRPRLLNDVSLFTLYGNYEDYNVMADFIEKITIRKPATVVKLFDWVREFETLAEPDRRLFTSVFQSVLELLSHTSKYAPDGYDYDALMGELADIPFERRHLYHRVFKLFRTGLGVGINKKDLVDAVLTGVRNRVTTIDKVDYRFMAKDRYRDNIDEILQSQDVCEFSTLLQINGLLDTLYRDEAGPRAFDMGTRLVEIIGSLPLAGISKEAPRHLRGRVMPYTREALQRDLALLVKHIQEAASASDQSKKSRTARTKLKLIIKKIEKDYLLHQLKDYLLATAYAVNARNPKLKVFLNPNMSRLHDFSYRKGRTPWNYCGLPLGTDFLAEFGLSGGLSRLNIVFAAKWQDSLFGRTNIYSAPHLQALLVNILDLYPLPSYDRDTGYAGYNARMVDFGLELIRSAREKGNETMREEVLAELGTITTGYHYRKAVDYLDGRGREHRLFLSEIRGLGDAFFKKGKYPELCDCKDLGKNRDRRLRRLGNIYYRTFGNLTPQPMHLFPQDVSFIFDSGWVSGEMVEEFKVKLDRLLYKKKISPDLLGPVLYFYLTRTVPRILSQNHKKDHTSTYFVFEVFNNSHLNKIIKNLKKEGYLKLK